MRVLVVKRPFEFGSGKEAKKYKAKDEIDDPMLVMIVLQHFREHVVSEHRPDPKSKV